MASDFHSLYCPPSLDELIIPQGKPGPNAASLGVGRRKSSLTAKKPRLGARYFYAERFQVWWRVGQSGCCQWRVSQPNVKISRPDYNSCVHFAFGSGSHFPAVGTTAISPAPAANINGFSPQLPQDQQRLLSEPSLIFRGQEKGAGLLAPPKTSVQCLTKGVTRRLRMGQQPKK